MRCAEECWDGLPEGEKQQQQRMREPGSCVQRTQLGHPGVERLNVKLER